MLKQKEWIDILVSKLNCTKKDAKDYYDCVFESIRDQVSPENPVKISGFGVFKIRKTAAKQQVNLITGETVIVPEHNVVVFKPYFEIEPKPEAIEVEIDTETPVEDTPVEATPVEDTPVEEVPVEETPVETAPVEETPVEDEEPTDGIVWIYEGRKCSTETIADLLTQKTTLTKDDVTAALDVVKKNIASNGTVEVKEDNDTFDFVISK